MARSESNAVGNTKYPDLNMTSYPEKIDTRQEGAQGYNPNMKGYENLNDYNMAEHVNALADAVMAIQRVLGINPQIDNVGADKTNVATRIQSIESKNFDDRYGGTGWSPANGQTLVGHTHTGGPGRPSQINLSSEVQGLLPKSNLNLNADVVGLTGSDISVSSTISTKIADAMNDKLSTTQGGQIQGNLTVKNSLSTRLTREWAAQDFSGGSTATDYTTLSNSAKVGDGAAQTVFLNEDITNLQYGKYVIGVRVKTGAAIDENILTIKFYDEIGGTSTLQASTSVKGSEMTAGEWKMLYLVVDHIGDATTSKGRIEILRPSTNSTAKVSVDHAYIMPATPAVFDR